MKFFQFLYKFLDFIEKFGWSWSLASILGSAISGRNSLSQNEGQTSRSFKFFDEIQKFIQKLKEKVELDHLKSWPQFWQFWTLNDCNVSSWVSWSNLMMNNCCYGSYASFPTLKNKIHDQPFFSFGNSGAHTV